MRKQRGQRYTHHESKLFWTFFSMTQVYVVHAEMKIYATPMEKVNKNTRLGARSSRPAS
jgi:hypothetical protein